MEKNDNQLNEQRLTLLYLIVFEFKKRTVIFLNIKNIGNIYQIVNQDLI